MSTIEAHASLESQRQAESFIEAVKGTAAKGATFDDAAAAEMIEESLSRNAGVKVPEHLKAIFDDASDDQRNSVMADVMKGVNAYERRHGKKPSGDVLMNAFQTGYSLLNRVRGKHGLSMDSATNAAHDPISLHPNAPQIGTMTAIAEAVPFAGYQPANMDSNEARIIIVSNQSGSATGQYPLNNSLDGAASGDIFMRSERVQKVAAGAIMTGQFRFGQLTRDTQDPASVAAKVIRGRTAVYVNGIKRASDQNDAYGTAATSTISGPSFTLNGVSYQLGGTATPSTGAFSVTSTPALPVGAQVRVVGYINFEDGQELLAARFNVLASQFSVFATPNRAIVTASVDSASQFQRETGYSPIEYASSAMRAQFYNERHYTALDKLYEVAANNGNVDTFDFSAATVLAQKTRPQRWDDFAPVLHGRSQRMAIDTAEHGITHMYVPENVASDLHGLDASRFTPSGIAHRPGIYRIGRLASGIECYYSPKVVAQSADRKSATVLCIGTSPMSGRNPIVIGDAVAPMVTPKAMVEDMKSGYLFYARDFVEVNPHAPSALGAALINVTNLY